MCSMTQAGHLRKIAGYGEPSPGGNGNFRIFSNRENGPTPTIDGDNIAFAAVTDLGEGMYVFMDGKLQVVATTRTLIPGTSFRFGFDIVDGSGPDISGRNVAFKALNLALGGSIWIWKDGVLVEIVDTNTPVPGGVGTFRSFGPGGSSPSISGENIVFNGFGDQGDGIYAYMNGKLRVIADTNTPLPGASSLPTNFGGGRGTSPSISGENIAFYASWNFEGDGIFAYKAGKIESVVLGGTQLPKGSPAICGFGFAGFSFMGGSPSISGNHVAFNSGCGVYASINNKYRVVADSATLSPYGSGDFEQFGVGSGSSPSIDGENVAFLGRAHGYRLGVFANVDGCVRAIAGQFTPVPDTVFENPTFSEFGMGYGVGVDISGRNVVFMGIPDRGIYVGNVDDLPIHMSDMTFFQRCFGGKGVPITDDCCRRFDTDLDNDIDLTDHNAFLPTMTGPE